MYFFLFILLLFFLAGLVSAAGGWGVGRGGVCGRGGARGRGGGGGGRDWFDQRRPQPQTGLQTSTESYSSVVAGSNPPCTLKAFLNESLLHHPLLSVADGSVGSASDGCVSSASDGCVKWVPSFLLTPVAGVASGPAGVCTLKRLVIIVITVTDSIHAVSQSQLSHTHT